MFHTVVILRDFTLLYFNCISSVAGNNFCDFFFLCEMDNLITYMVIHFFFY